MTESRAPVRIVATRVASGLVGLTLLTAIGVHVLIAAEARRWLGFTFPGVPRRIGEAAAIFANNARLLASVLAACIAVQAAHRGPDRGAGRLLLVSLRAVCDAALLIGCAVHILYVGSALGAYGGRTVEAMLPHGPGELAAFSLALGLYLTSRRHRLTLRSGASTAALAASTLAVSATLEVFAR